MYVWGAPSSNLMLFRMHFFPSACLLVVRCVYNPPTLLRHYVIRCKKRFKRCCARLFLLHAHHTRLPIRLDGVPHQLCQCLTAQLQRQPHAPKYGMHQHALIARQHDQQVFAIPHHGPKLGAQCGARCGWEVLKGKATIPSLGFKYLVICVVQCVVQCVVHVRKRGVSIHALHVSSHKGATHLSCSCSALGVHPDHIDMTVVAAHFLHARVSLKRNQLLSLGSIRCLQGLKVALCFVKSRLWEAHQGWVMLNG